MAYKYQLIFLGDIKNNACDTIKACFFDKIHSIGLKNNMFEVIYNETFYKKYLNKQPSFVFYFGNINHSEKDIEVLKVFSLIMGMLFCQYILVRILKQKFLKSFI